MTGIPSHPMARDKERPHLHVILDNQYLVLKGTGSDVDPTILTGHVRLFLTEPTSFKEITLQFKGKAKIPILTSDSIIASSSQVVCNHDWSFLQGDKKHSHTLNAGRHLFPFHLEISPSLPSTLSTSALGGASVAYKLHAVAVRTGFSHNFQAEVPVFILRSLTREALEYQQTLDIESTWPEKIMYAITLPHKAWAAGDTLTAIVKLSPLAKGVYVQAIDSSISETTKIYTKGGSHEVTRVAANVRHEIIDRKAVEIEVASPVATGSLGTPTAHFAPPPRSSRPASPHFGSSSSSYHHSSQHPPSPQHHEQQEDEDLSNDVVTYLNLAIPRSSAYPFFYSASHFASTTATPPRSASLTPQYALPTNSATSQPPTSPSLSFITPSHSFEPITVSHRMSWIIFIHNKDGHLSELRCSLPIKILDGALLEESRAFTMRARRLLLRTSGLGNILSRGGEEGSEDEGDERMRVDEEEERVEADRELPSYPAHVRDRVANMYLSEAVTMRVSNPWVGRVGPAPSTSGTRTSSTPELSELVVPNRLIPDVSPSDIPVSDVPHNLPESRTSRSGHSTPTIQQRQQVDMIPHLDLVNSELFLSLGLDNETVRRFVGEQQQQQQQSQPQHQHQHQSNSHTQQHQQHSRTLRWGSRAGSKAGSRAASPERSPLSSVTTSNHNGPSSHPENGGGHAFPSSVVSSSSSAGSGFASPFQHLFKATIKPFTALAAHHGHGHRATTHPLMESTPVAGTSSGLGASAIRPSALNLDLPSTCPPSGIDLISSSSVPSSPGPHNETNRFTITRSPSSQSLAANATLTSSSSSSFSDPSSSTSTYPTSTSPPSPPTSTSSLSYTTDPENQDPSSCLFRAFSVVPDYSIASRGFIGGGVPPLSSMHGLPSYEEAAEAQRREREVTVQTRARMKGRGSMSESDVVGLFGRDAASVRPFECGRMQEVSRSMHDSGASGIMQQLQDEDGDDEGDDDDVTGGACTIQMHTKKVRT